MLCQPSATNPLLKRSGVQQSCSLHTFNLHDHSFTCLVTGQRTQNKLNTHRVEGAFQALHLAYQALGRSHKGFRGLCKISWGHLRSAKGLQSPSKTFPEPNKSGRELEKLFPHWAFLPQKELLCSSPCMRHGYFEKVWMVT